MKKLLCSALLALALGTSAASSAFGLDVEPLSWRDMDRWLSGSVKQITNRFANKTIQIKVTSRALGGLKGGPPTGPLILYLAPGGKMLTWTSGSKTVGTGRWEIKTLAGTVEIPCFYFDGPKGPSECFFGGSANYVEAAKGNPFKLAAGAPVPARLSGSNTISSLAGKLGL